MLKSLKTSLIASAVPWGIGYSLGYQTLSSHKGTYRSELSTEDGGQRAGPGHGTNKAVFQSVLYCGASSKQCSFLREFSGNEIFQNTREGEQLWAMNSYSLLSLHVNHIKLIKN